MKSTPLRSLSNRSCASRPSTSSHLLKMTGDAVRSLATSLRRAHFFNDRRRAMGAKVLRLDGGGGVGHQGLWIALGIIMGNAFTPRSAGSDQYMDSLSHLNDH